MLPCGCQVKEGQNLLIMVILICAWLCVWAIFFFLSVFAGKNVIANVWWEGGFFPPGAVGKAI